MSNATAMQLLTNANLHNAMWGKRIATAEANGSFTHEDNDLANRWPTDANGHIEDWVETVDDDGEPIDTVLHILSSHLTDCVFAKNYTGAAIALIAVSTRNTQLKELYELKHMMLPA
jgi:hypothetical protein